MAVSKKKTSDMNASSEKNPSEKALSREVIFETLTDMLSELLDMKKSSMAPDESPRQVTEGKGVKCSVDKAVKEQFLINVSVTEKTRKRFISYHIRSALILIPESLLAALIAGTCIPPEVSFPR